MKLFSENNEHYIKIVHLSTHAVKGARRNGEADLLPLRKKRLQLNLGDPTSSDLDGRRNSIEASAAVPGAVASRLWLSQGPGLCGTLPTHIQKKPCRHTNLPEMTLIMRRSVISRKRNPGNGPLPPSGSS